MRSMEVAAEPARDNNVTVKSVYSGQVNPIKAKKPIEDLNFCQSMVKMYFSPTYSIFILFCFRRPSPLHLVDFG